ncbi:NAD(P)-binding domain-containing protein [Micrococcaceae bacterium Sec5.1]
MKVGILGAGSIGATLTRRLSTAGHEVRVANSRGPESIDPSLLTSGAVAVSAADVAIDADVFITSIPLSRTPGIRPLLEGAAKSAIVIDTSNYYPERDGRIAVLDYGRAESLWISEQLGRPVTKAWNAITSESLADKPMKPGTSGRISIPVASDDDTSRAVAMQLIDETGFDAYDAGPLAESWRFQPGSPAYCTDLTSAEMSDALASAQKNRSPLRRDLVWKVIAERTDGFKSVDPDFGDYLVRLNRAIYL